MAATPTFATSLEALKKRCRLSSAKAGDVTDVIDSEVQSAYLRFARDLGISEVARIKAIPYTDAPTTNDGFVRMTAQLTEEKLVTLGLMRRLPMMFLDASASQLSEWQDAPTRPARGPNLEAEIARLESEIAQGMSIMLGETSQGEAPGIRAATIERPTAAPVMGGSAFGGRAPWPQDGVL